MPLVHQAIKDAGIDADMLASVTHLITVSCTGVTAPGLDIDMLEQLPISRQIQRTHITFMGCYAAITALAQAQAWCRSVPGARVLVVDVELCSLHFQSEATEDNLLANSLFADGAAAVLIQSGEPQPSGLRIDGFCSEVLLEGRHEMGWRVSSYGYQMRLSGVVPDYIAPAVPGFLERVADEMKLQNQPLRLLLHPGGKRIVDAVARVTAMNPEDRERSLYVLRRYGNMSSVTILFILRDVLYETHEPIEDQAFLAMAFGPGLCMESCLLRRRHD